MITENRDPIIFDNDPLAACHERYPDYLRSVADGRGSSAENGDFWAFLREVESSAGTSGAAAEPAASENHGWDDVVAKLNSETRQSSEGGIKPSAPAGNHGWDEIVSRMNSQIRR